MRQKIKLINNSQQKICHFTQQHALIGVSPFNSFFTEHTLIKLINWGLNTFENVTIFIPDKISVFTLKALGYSRERAEWKTRRQDSYLVNKVIRAFSHLGFDRRGAFQKIMMLSNLAENVEYNKLYYYYLNKFEEDTNFREGCLSTSSWVLYNNPRLKLLSAEAINTAVKYFLQELPLFIDTPRILGVESSVFVYHSIPSYLETIYLNGATSPFQSFLQVNVDSGNEIPSVETSIGVVAG